MDLASDPPDKSLYLTLVGSYVTISLLPRNGSTRNRGRFFYLDALAKELHRRAHAQEARTRVDI